MGGGSSNGITAGAKSRWLRDPASFIREVLVNPETGRPFELYPVQERFLREALTLTPDGALPYPELVFSTPKKGGKTATSAMAMLYVIVVLAGPYAEGYCCANDYEQAQGRVFQAICRIIEKSPLLKRSAKITSDRIEFPSIGSTITALASHYASAAGSNPSFITFDELWAYVSSGAERMWDEMIPVPTRKVSARWTATYAGYEGESKLLEGLYQRGLQGEQIAPDLYRQPGLLMYWTHDPVAPWQTPRWLEQMRRQHRPNAYLRQIENRWVSNESTFVPVEEWEACVDPNLRPVIQDRDLEVYAGLDCSVRSDFTALTVVAFDERANNVRIVDHRVFKPNGGDINFTAVEEEIIGLSRRFDLRMVSFDPHQAEYLSQRLRTAGIPMDHFHQTPDRQTQAAANLVNLISQRNIISYPSQELRDAVANSRIIENTKGFRLAKITGSRKIDLIVALSFAVVVALREGRGEPGMLGYYRILAWGGSFDDGGPDLYAGYERGMREFEEKQRPQSKPVTCVGDPGYRPPSKVYP